MFVIFSSLFLSLPISRLITYTFYIQTSLYCLSNLSCFLQLFLPLTFNLICKVMYIYHFCCQWITSWTLLFHSCLATCCSEGPHFTNPDVYLKIVMNGHMWLDFPFAEVSRSAEQKRAHNFLFPKSSFIIRNTTVFGMFKDSAIILDAILKSLLTKSAKEELFTSVRVDFVRPPLS
jgi:hypothetical protein